MVNFVKKSLPVYLDITLMAKYKHLAWLAVGYSNGGGLKPNGDQIKVTFILMQQVFMLLLV
jgi:hypothetical protein